MSGDPAAALEVLRLRFLSRAAGDLATLQNHARGGDVGLEDVRFLIHRLAGAAGVFGYASLSEAAARLDAAFQDGPQPTSADVEAFIAVLAQTIGSSHDPLPDRGRGGARKGGGRGSRPPR